MGCAVIDEAMKDSAITISAGFGKYNDQLSGIDLGDLTGKKDLNLYTSDDLTKVISVADIIIDFSSPELSLKAAEIAAEKKKVFVSGTTGFSNQEFKILQEYAKNTVILWSSNMSIGINLLHMLVAQTSKLLNNNFDTEIIEMHHKHKKDSPSGTAISLGKTIANAKKLTFDKVAKLSREGRDCQRETDEIGFATIRGGSVIGDHTVIFADDNERIELSHKAVHRNIFAAGALKAAKWAKNQKPGFYSIKDVLADI